MLRVLSPSEQKSLTVDAQALIYKYSSHKWVSPQQLEDLITEVVTIARIRQVPADDKLVCAVLYNMGDESKSGINAGSSENSIEPDRPLS